eukprot:GFUD01033301.1.p1 GENE.GFUD01033301.1~~GFUD01033301.1.p1  ORF type:complete len:627 (-),score=167.99 GFUD01033301.1:49-1890(-)
MTAFKKAKSNNWIDADNDFGDFDCLKDEVSDLKKPQPPRKRPRENNNTLKNAPRSNSVPSEPPDLTQKNIVESSDLWINKHQPDRLEDLAVNPKKVEEVRWWLENTGQSGGILLLSGPAGSGKTASILALAKKLGIEIQEWVNPIEQVNYGDTKGLLDDEGHFVPYDTVGYNSKAKQFKDWLRGAKYTPLSSDVPDGKCSNLILIEDMPNYKVDEFHQILESYSNSRSRIPLIFVISETASAKKSGSTKQIFPPEILERLKIQSIVFNPVTTTNLVKILTKMALLESQKGARRFKVPDKNTLENLAESVGGDIRGAVNALQFSCLNETSDLKSAFEGVSKIASSKPGKNGSKNDKVIGSELSKIGGKDQSLVMFHALGKILYAKRSDQMETHPLPSMLEKHSRRVLKSNPDEVIEKTTLSPDPFNCFLHHNYPPFFTKIQDVQRLSEYFSVSDLFLKEWGTSGKMSLSEYGGSVAARAVMFCNTAMTPNLGMRKLTKPEHYLAARTEKNRSYAVQNIFHAQPSKELSTSTIPLLAQIRPAHIPITKMATITEVGTFPGMKQAIFKQTKAIDQNDIFEDSDDEFEKEFVETEDSIPAVVPEDDDDEVNIEEFDD